jgi:DNA-binding transcriptional MocR family regulator
VIVEPIAGNMGVIPAQPKFLEALRKETRKVGALLIFDEVISGFRIGYVSGPAEIVREFSLYKQGANLHSSSFDQSILAAYLGRVGPEGMFTRIRKNCEFYRANCEALQGALDRELGGRVSYVRPDGGFFLWLELKQDEGPIDTFEMIGTLAREMGVLAIPGSGFSVTGSQANCLRLSFSQQSPEQLADGIRRLARMRTRYLETQARREKEPSQTTN